MPRRLAGSRRTRQDYRTFSWAIFFFGRIIGHSRTGILAGVLEFLGMNWMAVVFLTFLPLLLIDLITLYGFFMPWLSASLKGFTLKAFNSFGSRDRNKNSSTGYLYS
jgi:hypothetical protein